MAHHATTGVLADMIGYFGADARMVQNTVKVHSFAKSIGERSHIEDRQLEILEIAAILHDIGVPESFRKYNSGDRHEEEVPPVARKILESFDLDGDVVERVCYLVGHHHQYDKIDDVVFQILVEADYLVNIFEGNVPHEAVSDIKAGRFKTEIGTSYLESMYSDRL